MDRLDFVVEDTLESPMAKQQAAPYVNGKRLTSLLRLEFDAPGARQFGEHNIGLEPATTFLPSTHYLVATAPEWTRAPGTTVILRCCCGDFFCTQVVAEVNVTATVVEWANIRRCPAAPCNTLRTLRFDREQYESALSAPRTPGRASP
jgi:hypothetical protein